MKKVFRELFTIFFSLPLIVNGQSGSYTDPGQAYNRILLEKSGNTYYRIGAFKVIGTPYLFGENQTGNLYSTSGNLENVKIHYNTFSQGLEIVASSNVNTALSIEINNVDSFSFLPDNNHNDLWMFLNRKIFNEKAKGFFLQVYPGKKYSLYKLYKSSLAIVTTNYVQSELRQFELEYDYYYFDIAGNKLKLIKPSANFLKNEFKDKADIKLILNQNSKLSSEALLLLLFSQLNK